MMLDARGVSIRKTGLLSRYSSNLGELLSRKRAEQALRSAKIEAEAASRTKSEFLANMSHELRTPLNAIIGFADLMRHFAAQGRDLEKSLEYATHISGAGKHLLNIISDILDISKIESGTFTLDIEPHSVREIIDASLLLIRDRARAKKQALEFKAAPDLPVLPLDAARAKQILINLLSNANKFTGEGGRILVMAQRNADGGATIAVADTGIGMTEDQIAIAMEPFGQVESSFSRAHEGTGLGLPIAVALTKQHGGEFHISSRPGAGTTIVVTFPAAVPQKAVPVRAPRTAHPAPAARPPHQTGQTP